MPITRKFFDWTTPALPRIVDWLCETRTRGGLVDLSDVILVFPGGRAGRRFSELLTERTQGRNDPPRIVTPSALPELLYPPQRPFANGLTQQLAWKAALQTLSPSELRVLTDRPPAEGDDTRWTALADLILRNHTELAADGHDFSSVVRHGDGLPGFREHERWEVLWSVQDRYLALLDRLELWDRETARLKAIENHECHTESSILLVATVDMNRTLRQMLDQVANHVTALIHAPESLASCFDEHGCLCPEMWAEMEIPLDAARVEIVDGPGEQAAEVAYALAELDGHYAPREITVGIPDESLVPSVRRQLAECNLPSRSIVEKPLPQTLPVTFLAAVADYLDNERVDNVTALLRHPDVDAWLAREGVEADWLTELDCYISGHLQPRLGDWLGKPGHCRKIRKVVERLRRLLQPLLKQTMPLNEWSEAISSVLLELYGAVALDEEDAAQRITLIACHKIHAALEEPASIPAELMPMVAPSEAIRTALEHVAADVAPPEESEEAVELLGWLEMPLDDAPVAIITSFNEGFVPTSVNSDLFLPNSLRHRLGVLDNIRRYARDAYALNVLLHSRRSLTLICGRRDAEGDLLKPSRLLFAAPPDAIARRVQQFYAEDRGEKALRPPLCGGLTTSRSTAGFRIPRPEPTELRPLRVTSFKDYIACPYRFYLKHQLRLSSLGDQVDELDSLAFGSLLHGVLAEFGNSKVRDSRDEGKIAVFLRKTLEQQAQEQLGSARRPAVRIQLEQLQRRLDGFAVWQAHHADLGYRIHYVEERDADITIDFDVGDGRTIPLRGRIDRIDYNAQNNRWLILDYKTGKGGDSPETTHFKKTTGWTDLQLPLYRHLARAIGVEGPVDLAYIVLPDVSEGVDLLKANWTDEDLESADAFAREVGRKILDGVFWPPAEKLKWPQEEYAVICHDGTFDGEPLPGVTR